MLETFRKISNNIIFKILFGILLLSFAFSGLTGVSRMHFSEDYAVKIGHERISQQEVDKKYEEAVRNIRRQGMDFNDEQLAASGISKEQIKRTLIQESLLRQYVNDLGIEAGDEAVTDEIKSIPQFQTNGEFDRAKFTGVIASQGMNEEQFTTILRSEIKNTLLTSTIANNIPINDFIAGKQAQFDNETRDVEVAVIPKSFHAPLTEPTEKELKDFYNENSYRFQTPETRDINYVKIEKNKANEATIYDTTVKIEDALAGGSTLKEIADKMNLKIESKKDLLNNDQGFSELFLQTAFGKDKGQSSDLVLDAKNNEYFVIEVTDVKPARIPELAEVKEKVVAGWKENNANDQNLKYIEKMTDELKASGGSLQSFAASNGYKYQVLKDIKRNETEQYGARLVNAAFDAKDGEVLGSFENQDGTYKIAKLKAVNMQALKPEDEAKYKTQMANIMRTEVMDEYLEYLRTEYPVKFGAEKNKQTTASADLAAVGNGNSAPAKATKAK